MECLMKENLGDYDSGVIATWYMARVMRHHFSFECFMTYPAIIMWALSCDTVGSTIVIL